MPEERPKNLEWFKENIELQLEDVELEQAEKKIILYFDTSDVQTAVTGLKAFYRKDGKFRKRAFLEKRTLVNTLMAVGWLGEFSLLPPHLSEFYGKAENNFNLKPTTDWENEIINFIKDLKDNFNLLDEENGFENLKGKSEEELEKVFSNKAGDGVHWFKAIYSMTPWHRKLGVWLRTGLLNLEEKKFDYEKTVKSDAFGELRQVFNRHRPLETINNIVDAAALTYLMELVENFNNGDTSQVPRFFVPKETTSLWRDVLRELDWRERFICNFKFSHGNRSSSIFRQEDYFLYKITFRRNIETNDNSDSKKDSRADILKTERAMLTKLCSQVNEAIESLSGEPRTLYAVAGNWGNEAVKNLSEESDKYQMLEETQINQDLVKLINSLRDYSVLEKDWFKNDATKEFRKIINQSKESKAIIEEQREIYENKSFKKFVADQLEDKREELFEELEDFRLASQLYDELYNSIGGLKKRISNYPGFESDEFFPVLGLLRYGFPERIQPIIIEVLNKLRSGEADNIRTACADIIRCYIDGRKNPVEKADELMIAVAALLAVNNSSLLNKLFTNIKLEKLHFSLKIVYSEFLFRREPKQEANTKKALSLLSDLEKEWENLETKPDSKANLSVGLAYLYYWAWRSGEAIPMWKLQLEKKPLRTDFRNYHIQKAINFADEAYLNLAENQPEKKAYALNQYLFYSIEGSDNKSFLKLKDRRDALREYKENRKIWQFRFDDTLARYYFRLAFLPEYTDKKKDFIKWAKDYVDKAQAMSDGDVEVEMFHDEVKRIWEDI